MNLNCQLMECQALKLKAAGNKRSKLSITKKLPSNTQTTEFLEQIHLQIPRVMFLETRRNIQNHLDAKLGVLLFVLSCFYLGVMLLLLK